MRSGATLAALSQLLRRDGLSNAASARLHAACRALAQAHDQHSHGTLPCLSSADGVGHELAPQPLRSKHAAAPHCTMAPSVADGDRRIAVTPDRHPFYTAAQLQHDHWQRHVPFAAAIHGYATISARACSAAADGSGEAQQSQQPQASQAAAAAAARVAAAEDAESPDGGSDAPSAGGSPDAATAEPGQQSDAAAETTAAETQELDEMLQQMAAEAEDMILGGHPQETIQHLTEGMRSPARTTLPHQTAAADDN